MGVGEIDGSVWLLVFGGLVIQDAWVGDTAGRGGVGLGRAGGAGGCF